MPVEREQVSDATPSASFDHFAETTAQRLLPVERRRLLNLAEYESMFDIGNINCFPW